MIGKKFSRLIVVRKAETKKINGKNKIGMWFCVCDCGETVEVETHRLNSGHTRSCGCLRADLRRASKGKPKAHGHFVNGKPTKLYSTWQGIKDRCTNKKSKDFYRYGGRGITISEEWLDFNVFKNDVGEPPSNKHQLDRTNNNQRYSKENCRWVTQKENVNNRSNSMNRQRQQKCSHPKKETLWVFCPLCGLPYSDQNPDGSKAGVVNA